MSGLPYTARHPATAYSNVASVIMQLVASADTPITIKRMQLQSAVTSSGQAIVVLQAGRYATPHAAGTTGTPQAINRRASSIAADAAFRYASATLGTTLTIFREWQWNIAMPWEEQFGDEALEFEIPAGDNFVLVLPNASGTPTLSGGIDFVER